MLGLVAVNEAHTVDRAAAARTVFSVAGQRQRLSKLVLGALVVYALLRPLLGFAHELTVAALAATLQSAVSTRAWEPALGVLGLDPVHAGAAILASGGVQVAGFAVAAPIGNLLHAVLPAVFLASDRVADGAGVSMVAAPGAPPLGRGIASFGADAAWLAIGLWLFWRWRLRDRRVALLGLVIQAQVAVNHLLAGRSTMTIGLTVLVFVYGVAALVVLSLGRRRWGGALQPSSLIAGITVALAVACSPLGHVAVGSTNWETTVVAASIVPPGAVQIASTPAPSTGTGTTEPTDVRVVQQPGGGWQYVVDGSAETIRGVGYNPWYANLSPTQRAALYARDFSAMHRLGINTIDGWFENQFDQVTLDAAASNDIGVLMPFELNQDLDYTDPAVRSSILDRLSAYVEQYRNHPAVRMWAPGNENLHRILFANWVSRLNDPVALARAQAMATFLPVVVDRIHELDPNHPVVYRDADDEYLPWISSGFAAAGGERPWLIYGANVYTAPQMQEVISAWPAQWPGHALLITEFAPGDISSPQRPLEFDQLWKVVRSRPEVVLGGLAYAWATNGPEDLDRVFGLVDPYGVPTDGRLAALSTDYLSDSGATP